MSCRVTIYLDEELLHRARSRAGDLGISFAEYGRRVVREDLDRTQGDISAIFGLGNSGGSNVAKYKHEYVGEAIDTCFRDRRRKR